MTNDKTTQEEIDDLDKRVSLQNKLQEATRRSAPPSVIQAIQNEISAHNQKLEAYASRRRHPK